MAARWSFDSPHNVRVSHLPRGSAKTAIVTLAAYRPRLQDDLQDGSNLRLADNKHRTVRQSTWE